LQEKSLRLEVYPNDILTNIAECMILHNHRYFKTNGLNAFCIKHDINYNSARKIMSGSVEYPGVKEQIENAIESDLVELKQTGSVQAYIN